MIKKPYPVHPFLLVLFPVVFTLAHNAEYIRPFRVLEPGGALLVCTVVAVALAGLVFRDIHKGAVVVSAAIFAFFSFGHVGNLITVLNVRLKYQLLAWAVFLLIVALVTWRRKAPFGLTKILNLITACLLGVSVLSYAHAAFTSAGSSGNVRDDQASEQVGAPSSEKQDELPDIYYLVFERYARDDVLREQYGFDNSEFLSFLKKNGFYVAEESHANYLKTAHSLASSLNTEHLLDFADKVGRDSCNWKILHERVQEHKVGKFLKSKGYRYLHFGSFWHVTDRSDQADENINIFPFENPLTIVLIESSMAYPMLKEMSLYDVSLEQYRRVLYKFEKMAEVPDRPGPSFVFAHMFVTHEPFVFHKDGSYMPKAEWRSRPERDVYLDAMQVLNHKLEETITAILAKSKVPPVIILQADEGPFPDRYAANPPAFEWRQARPDELKRKMCIFNAYHVPKAAAGDLYPTITPVNTFRLIFNTYFNAGLKMLPDTSYVFEDDRHIYSFYDITDQIP